MHIGLRFYTVLAIRTVLLCLLLSVVAVAQTSPTLTPTVPLPNNPTVQKPVQAIPAQPAWGQTVCTQEYAPVCAQIRGIYVTYSNQCFARAAGAEIISEGPCASDGPRH